MFKIRIILMSALLFLLVGVNAHVKAAVNSSKLVQKKTDQDSDKESKEHETQETITNLDFFSAFSLVNIQLHWRDFHVGLKDETTKFDSFTNATGLSLEEVETLSLENQTNIVVSAPISTNTSAVLPLTIFRPIHGKSKFVCDENVQVANTIAYIQNCASDPVRS